MVSGKMHWDFSMLHSCIQERERKKSSVFVSLGKMRLKLPAGSWCCLAICRCLICNHFPPPQITFISTLPSCILSHHWFFFNQLELEAQIVTEHLTWYSNLLFLNAFSWGQAFFMEYLSFWSVWNIWGFFKNYFRSIRDEKQQKYSVETEINRIDEHTAV